MDVTDNNTTAATTTTTPDFTIDELCLLIDSVMDRIFAAREAFSYSDGPHSGAAHIAGEAPLRAMITKLGDKIAEMQAAGAK